MEIKYLRIAIFCRNRPGLLQAITRKLTDLGADLGPTSFSILGNGAEFSTVAAVEKSREIWEFDSAILVMPLLADAHVSVQEYSLGKGGGTDNRVNLLLTVTGTDRPGLLADLTEFLYSRDVKVVRMTTEIASSESDSTFTTRLTVWIEPDHVAEVFADIETYSDTHDLSILQIIL